MVLTCDFLKQKITQELNAVHVEVYDDSDGCGAKFRVVVVSPMFEGKPMLQCHKLVNAALHEELKDIHAFSQKTYSLTQWEKQTGSQSATCSAPGKVILFGEHSVVYGKTAVAACLSRRTTITITSQPGQSIVMDMPEVGLTQFKVDLPQDESSLQKGTALESSLLGSLLQDPGIKNFGSIDSKSDEKILARLNWWAELIEKHRQVQFSEQVLSVLAYLHSFLTPAGKFSQGLSVKVASELRPGAGTGSSAAYAVALAGAFGKFYAANLDNTKIKDLAWQAERLVHGKPSGLDTTVVCDGEIVKFPTSAGVAPRPVWPLRILLVDSGVARNTKKMVEIAAEKVKVNGNKVLDDMDQIAIKAIDALILPEDQGYPIVEKLVSQNQDCLEKLGVSHPALDLIIKTAAEFGLKAKITGAGGGGNAFVLLPPGLNANKLSELQAALNKNGFVNFEVTLFGPGILY